MMNRTSNRTSNRPPNPATKRVRNFAAAAALLVAIVIAVSAAPARADQWSKTYQVNGRADLHILTGDGDVTVTGTASTRLTRASPPTGGRSGRTTCRLSRVN